MVHVMAIAHVMAMAGMCMLWQLQACAVRYIAVMGMRMMRTCHGHAGRDLQCAMCAWTEMLPTGMAP